MTKHKKIYEKIHGKTPITHDIHHIDWNHENNVIDNLISIPKKIHKLTHKYLVLKDIAIIDNTNYIKHALVNFKTLNGKHLKDFLDDVSSFRLDEITNSSEDIILGKNGPEFMFLITKKLRK